MDFWSNLQTHKWISGGWILLFVICLLWMYLNRKRWNDNTKSICIFIGAAVVVVYNPVFAKLMIKSFLPSYLEYERVSWLLFINPLCAYVIVKTIQKLKKERRNKAFVVLLICGLLISNVALVSRGYTIPENSLKVPDDVISISESLIKDSSSDAEESKPQVLVQETEERDKMGDWMYHGIRQYTSVPVLTKVVIPYEDYIDEDFNLALYGLMDYEYFVCHNISEIREQAQAAGFELLLETDDYCLYKNMKVLSLYFVRHGQTDANVQGILAGSGTDAMLTEEGKSQARETGEALRNIKFSNAFISEMTRTRDTANCILHENVNKTPRCQKVEYLNDFYWGDLEGMTLDEVRNQYPDFTIDGYIGSSTDTSFVSPVGSWSKSYTIDRFKKAFWLMAASSENDANVLAVGHSGMLWYLQEQFSDEVAEDAVIDNASITVICYDKGTWTLRYLNLSAEEFENLEL